MDNQDRFGAALLGAALRKIFPHITYYGSGTDEFGFYAEFSDHQPFQKEHFPLIEQTMEKLLKGDFKVMEMVGENAHEMLKHHRQDFLKEKLKGLVKIIQIGPFFDVTEGEPTPCTAFALFDVIEKNQHIRIIGKSFKNPMEKQAFQKRFRAYKSPDEMAKSLELYEGDIWHPKGMLLKRTLEEVTRNFLKSRGYEEVDTPEPLKYPQKKFYCRGKIYNFEPDALNSSLQIIEKWIKIFDLETRWVTPAKRHLQYADALKIFRTGATLESIDGVICFTLFDDVKAFIALLVEKYKGEVFKVLKSNEHCT